MAVSAAVLSCVVPATAEPSSQPDPMALSAQSGTASPYERLIVGYKSGAAEATSDGAADADVKNKGNKVGRDLRLKRRMATGAAVVDLGGSPSPDSAAKTIAEFRADPDVAFAEPDLRMQPFAAPNDTEFGKQWDLVESTAGMNVPGAWASSTGSGVTVAVIDTGYVAHSDLASKVVAGYDFVSSATEARDGDGRDGDASDNGDWAKAGDCGLNNPSKDTDSSWHGTHVAGTIAAAANNSKGIAGIAYDAKVQPVRVLGRCGGSTSDIADAIVWASGGAVSGVPANKTPAKVLNLSLGGQSNTCPTAYSNAISSALSRGVTVVVAAGNSKADVSGFTPANCSGVITVAASNRQGNRAWYSNYGSKVDIAAPGGETRRENDGPGTTPENGIWSTLNAGSTTPGSENYEPYMGTSMAAPHIAGLAALLVAKKPSITPSEVESLIRNNARPLPGTCDGCGAGLADAAKTVAAITSGGGGGGGGALENTTDVQIPDNGSIVSSPITVSGVSGNASSALKVDVDIKHAFRGDLVVDLIAPDGTSYRLKGSSFFDGADNVRTTYTVNASSEGGNGTWQLRVQDVYSGDTGYIDAWKLTL